MCENGKDKNKIRHTLGEYSNSTNVSKHNIKPYPEKFLPRKTQNNNSQNVTET